LFLINPEVSERLAAKGQIVEVAVLFLVGTGSQVIGTVLNKISNWYVYRGSFDPAYVGTKRYKCFHWIVRQFWMDVLVDLVTVGVYGFVCASVGFRDSCARRPHSLIDLPGPSNRIVLCASSLPVSLACSHGNNV
jgi:hypothetical protein